MNFVFKYFLNIFIVMEVFNFFFLSLDTLKRDNDVKYKQIYKMCVFG